MIILKNSIISIIESFGGLGIESWFKEELNPDSMEINVYKSYTSIPAYIDNDSEIWVIGSWLGIKLDAARRFPSHLAHGQTMDSLRSIAAKL